MDPGPTRSQLAALAQELSGNRPSVVEKGEKKEKKRTFNGASMYVSMKRNEYGKIWMLRRE